MRWEVRNARADDAAAIEKFLLSIPEFGTLRPIEQVQVWRWLYSRDGETVKNVLIAENEQGTVIAHYGIAPLPYVLAEQKVEAGVASLLAIDEAYRKTPMFLDMTIRLIKLFRSSGGAFITGLANRAGLLEFHKAFGFKDIGEVPVFAKPIRIRKIAQSILPNVLYFVLAPCLWLGQWAWLILLEMVANKTSKSVRVEAIWKFDDAIAATSSMIAKHHKFYADRSNPSLLDRRFFGNDCRSYHVFRIVNERAVVGYVALRVMDMKGFLAIGIVDICFDFCERDLARAVFRAIDRFAIEQRADLISILTNSAPLIAQLRANFYLKSPESFRLLILESAKSFGLALSRIDDWFVTWFEHDYV